MWHDSEIVVFKVSYDGSAFSENDIDAKILADSLIGISKAIEETNQQINGEQSKVYIKVKSDFNPGSFEINLAQLLTSQGIQAAVNAITIIGFLGLAIKKSYPSLIQFIKTINGRKIITSTNMDNDFVKVYIENFKDPILIPYWVLICYENKAIIEAIKKTLSPLEYKGYDKISFTSEEYQPEIITKEEYFSIFLPECDRDGEEEILDTVVTEGIFGIAQANLEGYQKGWKLIRDGEDSFQVTILDQAFLKDVRKRKYSFCNRTAIRVKLRDITKRKKNIIHEYEVLEVIELYKPGSVIPKIIRKPQKQLFSDNID